MAAAELEARAMDERSMAAGGVESVEKWKRKGEASRRGTYSCQWIVVVMESMVGQESCLAKCGCGRNAKVVERSILYGPSAPVVLTLRRSLAGITVHLGI
jgi:hypothetical protein